MQAGRDPILAIDLGGTRIRSAYLRPDLTVTHREVNATVPALGVKGVLDRISTSAQLVLDAARAAGDPPPVAVGISSPGPLNPWLGVIHLLPNLPGWSDVHLADLVSEATGLPAVLDRDTNVALLAEWRHGAAVGAEHAVYITISTGFGGAAVVNGQLLHGPDGTAGELGHLTVDLDGPPDGEGGPGHVEGIASGAALAREGAALLKSGEAPVLASLVAAGAEVDAAAVCNAADAGDAACMAVMNRAWSAIGAVCAGIVNILNPEVIILGGAIANHRPDLHEAVRAEIARRAFAIPAARCRVVGPTFGDDVSLIGCWDLVADRLVRGAS